VRQVLMLLQLPPAVVAQVDVQEHEAPTALTEKQLRLIVSVRPATLS
jgi:hypothetical protein